MMMDATPPQGVDDETAMRRNRLAQMLRQNIPQEAYRTSGGTAMATGAQALGALGQDQRFMKWLSGQFSGPATPPTPPMAGG